MNLCPCEEIKKLILYLDMQYTHVSLNYDFVLLGFVAMRRAVNRRTSYPKDVLSE